MIELCHDHAHLIASFRIDVNFQRDFNFTHKAGANEIKGWSIFKFEIR